MNINFVYNMPTKVYFGENKLDSLAPELMKYGKKVLLVYGGGSIKSMGLYDKVMNELNNAGLEVFECGGIEPNPRHTSVNRGAEICRKENVDVVLAVGGGSVLDASKFIACTTKYGGDVWDIMTGKAPITDALPLVTILTLSATGSEMNSGGVISNIETEDKLGSGSPLLLPKVSFLDPTNTYTVNEYQTACGSVDIISHILEIYFNIKDEFFITDSFMEGLLKAVIKYAPIAISEPTNYEARANLMWASSWALNGFNSAGKAQAWSCHPIEHELSAYYDITHGLGLAILTPRWLEYVLDENTVSKFYQFGVNVFDIDKNLEPMEVAKQSIKMLYDFFFVTLKLDSTLSAIGIDESKFDIMSEKAASRGLQHAFKPLYKEDVKNILEMCK